MIKNDKSTTIFTKIQDHPDLELPQHIAEAFDEDKVGIYCDFLVDNNERYSFFSRNDGERILERHLYECLIGVFYVSSALKVSRETRLADVGTGAGLPGFLFACLREPPELYLIDSSKRKLGILEEFCKPMTCFEDVHFVYGRAEEIEANFDLVVMRALIPFPYVVELLCRLQDPGGSLALFSTLSGDIIQQEQSYLDPLGYVSRETLQPTELEFLGRRSINLLQKTSATKNGYPRDWKFIKALIKK